jgi:hypothetical protein
MRSDRITAFPLDRFARLPATRSREALANRSEISLYFSPASLRSVLKRSRKMMLTLGIQSPRLLETDTPVEGSNVGMLTHWI